MTKRGFRCIDLSLPLENYSMDRDAPHIFYWDHAEGGRRTAKAHGFDPDQIPDGIGLSAEDVTLNTHTGTHLDAPWHYGPTVNGQRAYGIDEVPLEWCFADGVVLDVTHKKAGELITAQDLEKATAAIDYRIKPLDIVMIRTDAAKRYRKNDFMTCQPGMGRESTLWLLDQGVKVCGIDAWSFDRPLAFMREDLKAGNPEAFLPAHRVGREREYCHIEKLANLDQLPRPTGFTVSVFPIKISRASGAWCRAVAILPE